MPIYKIVFKGKTKHFEIPEDLPIGSRIILKLKDYKFGIIFKKEKKISKADKVENYYLLDEKPLYKENELKVIDTLSKIYQLPLSKLVYDLIPKELTLVTQNKKRKFEYLVINENIDIPNLTSKQKEAFLFLKKCGPCLKDEFLKHFSNYILSKLLKSNLVIKKTTNEPNVFLKRVKNLRKYLIVNKDINISALKEREREIYLFVKSKEIVLKKELQEKYGSYIVNKLVKNKILLEIDIEENKLYKGLNSFPLKSEKLPEDVKDKSTKVLIGNYLKVFETFLVEALKSEGQSLFIFPDLISLHFNFEKYKNILKDKLGIYSRLLSLGERQNLVEESYKGNIKIIFTTPSGCFIPFENLNSIFLFEDQAPSYTQIKFPYINYLLVSYLRAKYLNIDFKLLSSVPKITNYYFFIKTQDLKSFSYKEEEKKVYILDLKKEQNLAQNFLISKKVLNLISLALKENEKIIIFYNKKGYDTHIVCPKCGKFPKCRICGIPLVYSKEFDILFCPICKKKYKKIKTCPNCNVDLSYYGIGIEKVYKFLKEKFSLKNDQILLFESFLINSKKKIETLLKSIKQAKIILSIYNYFLSSYLPETKYGIFLLGEKSIYSNSYEYFEGIYNAIKTSFYKVKNIIIQTFYPDLFVFKYLKKPYEEFFAKEILFRKEKNFPPYNMDIDIFYLSKDNNLEIVKEFSKELLTPIFKYIFKYTKLDLYKIPKRKDYFVFSQKIFIDKDYLTLVASHLFNYIYSKEIKVLYKINHSILSLI